MKNGEESAHFFLQECNKMTSRPETFFKFPSYNFKYKNLFKIYQLVHCLFSPFSIKRSNCYMVWGGDFTSSSQQTRFTQEDLVIGCLVDLATGLMTFTANGKECNTFFQVNMDI